MSRSTPALGATLIDAATIRARVDELAAQIDSHYAGSAEVLVMLCVLKGALMFTADLARRLSLAADVEFVTVRSYGHGTTTSGRPELVSDPELDVRGRDVLIVEDIVDSGHTAALLRTWLDELSPRSVRLVTLLDKTSRRQLPVRPDWRGFEVADRFVVGYGLDHGGRYRNLPELHVLDGA